MSSLPLKTRSGRVSKKFERYEPEVDEIIDDYTDDEEYESDMCDSEEDEEDEEEEEDEEDADDNGNLKDFVVYSDDEEDDDHEKEEDDDPILVPELPLLNGQSEQQRPSSSPIPQAVMDESQSLKELREMIDSQATKIKELQDRVRKKGRPQTAPK